MCRLLRLFSCEFCRCRSLLNTGLGRFGIKQKQPAPSDYDRVVIFVVGGVSCADVRAFTLAVEMLQEGAGGKRSFILGGTTLLAPSDVVDQLL